MDAFALLERHELSRWLRHACPSCRSEEVIRTQRRTLSDWSLSSLGLRPFRCRDCRRRFHAMPALRNLAVSRRERAALEALRNGRRRVWMRKSSGKRAAFLVTGALACAGLWLALWSQRAI